MDPTFVERFKRLNFDLPEQAKAFLISDWERGVFDEKTQVFSLREVEGAQFAIVIDHDTNNTLPHNFTYVLMKNTSTTYISSSRRPPSSKHKMTPFLEGEPAEGRGPDLKSDER